MSTVFERFTCYAFGGFRRDLTEISWWTELEKISADFCLTALFFTPCLHAWQGLGWPLSMQGKRVIVGSILTPEEFKKGQTWHLGYAYLPRLVHEGFRVIQWVQRKVRLHPRSRDEENMKVNSLLTWCGIKKSTFRFRLELPRTFYRYVEMSPSSFSPPQTLYSLDLGRQRWEGIRTATIWIWNDGDMWIPFPQGKVRVRIYYAWMPPVLYILYGICSLFI
jgi:hypothetical protein